MKVHPVSYGRYRRTAGVSAPGKETAQPEADSTTQIHVEDFVDGDPVSNSMSDVLSLKSVGEIPMRLNPEPDNHATLNKLFRQFV